MEYTICCLIYCWCISQKFCSNIWTFKCSFEDFIAVGGGGQKWSTWKECTFVNNKWIWSCIVHLVSYM